MEITTSQIGQTLAASNVGNGSVRDINRANESETQSYERTGSGAQSSTGNIRLQQANDRVSQAQEDRTVADNSNREQRNTAIELEDASRSIEQFLQSQNRNLAFSIDDGSNRSVVTVTEADSGEVIRQIPSEEVLRLAERLKDLQEDFGSSVGVLFNNQA